MAAVIGALRAVLSAQIAQFVDDMGKAGDSVARFSKRFQGIGKRMKSLGRSMSTSVSLPLAGVGAGIVKVAGDFEAGMNRVQAATGATADEISSMRDLAKELGAETTFSAREAADAMEVLAKNGLNAQQILEGATDASVKLAAATGSELAGAADVATDVMLNFNKSAKELGTLADGVTGVLLQSKFGFDDYRLALGQAGGVAGNLGVTFEDFNAVIAATSSAFASGSDAGTSFKNFLTRLVPQSKTAAAVISDLGLQFFNTDGSMRSMSEIAEELRTKMGGLTDEQLSQAMKDLFGVDAMRTAIMLMKQGADGLDAMRAKIADASAEEQAAARMKGFNGALEQLKGALETLAIAVADSGLLQFATDLVNRLADMINWLGQVNPELLKWGTVIGGLAAVFGPAIGGIGTFVSALGTIAPALALVGRAITTLIAATGPIGLLIAAVTTVVTVWQNWDTIGPIVQSMVQAVTSWLRDKLGAVLDWVKGKVEAVTGVFKAMYDKVVGHSYVPDMVDGIEREFGRLPDAMVTPAQNAASQVEDAFSSVADTVSGLFDKLLTDGKLTFDDLRSAAADLAKALFVNPFLQAFKSGPFGGGFGGQLLGGLFQGFAGMFAGGGTIPKGQWGIVGERGPEPVFAGSSDLTVFPNGSMPGGGVTQVFNIKTPDADSFRLAQRQLARMARQKLQV